MTESKSEQLEALRQALLQDEEFIGALAVAVSRRWGLGDNADWFFEKLIKKVRSIAPAGTFKADVVPMMWASPEDKERHRLRNDIRSLRYSVEVAQKRNEQDVLERLLPLLEANETKLAQLGG